MSTTGTIDRPMRHDPVKLTPMQSVHGVISDAHVTGAYDPCQNRTREMQLIPEALARARVHDRRRQVGEQRWASRLVAARRVQRRAERASLRARRALAMAIMQERF